MPSDNLRDIQAFLAIAEERRGALPVQPPSWAFPNLRSAIPSERWNRAWACDCSPAQPAVCRQQKPESV